MGFLGQMSSCKDVSQLTAILRCVVMAFAEERDTAASGAAWLRLRWKFVRHLGMPARAFQKSLSTRTTIVEDSTFGEVCSIRDSFKDWKAISRFSLPFYTFDV